MPETFDSSRIDRIADILFGVAHGGGLIEYGPLGRRVGFRPDHLGPALDSVADGAVERNEPIWTALAVAKETQRPSAPFYPWLRRLKPDDYAGLDDGAMWELERDRCYEYVRSRVRR